MSTGHEPNNAASRIAAFLEEAVANVSSSGEPLIEVFARALDLKAPRSSATTMRDVLASLAAAEQQLALLEVSALGQRRVPERAYKQHFEHVRQLLAPSTMFARWDSVSGLAGRATIDAFHFLAGYLPDDEPALAPDSLAELRRRASELEKLTEESDIAPELKVFVYARLDEIRKALREYPLRGGAALERAAQETAVAVGKDSKLAEALGKSKVGRGLNMLIAGVWAASMATGRTVIHAGEFLEGVERIEALAPVVRRELQIRAATEPKLLSAPPVVVPADATATTHADEQ